MSVIVPHCLDNTVKISSFLHKGLGSRRKPRQFLILGFPPCKPQVHPAIPLQFAYIDPVIQRALIERGWNFAQMRQLGKVGVK